MKGHRFRNEKLKHLNLLEVGRICKDVTMPVHIFTFIYVKLNNRPITIETEKERLEL